MKPHLEITEDNLAAMEAFAEFDNQYSLLFESNCNKGRKYRDCCKHNRARGTPPMVASRIHLDNPAPITERNGFTLLDITPDNVRVRLFAWRRENSSLDEIDHLEPYHDVKIER